MDFFVEKNSRTCTSIRYRRVKNCSEMKILALCSIKTQLWCFLKTKNSQKFLTWIWLNIFQLIMFKTWKKHRKGQKKTLKWNCLSISQCYILRNFQQFCQIWSKLLFSKVFLHISIKKWQNIYKFELESVKNPDSN